MGYAVETIIEPLPDTSSHIACFFKNTPHFLEGMPLEVADRLVNHHLKTLHVFNALDPLDATSKWVKREYYAFEHPATARGIVNATNVALKYLGIWNYSFPTESDSQKVQALGTMFIGHWTVLQNSLVHTAFLKRITQEPLVNEEQKQELLKMFAKEVKALNKDKLTKNRQLPLEWRRSLEYIGEHIEESFERAVEVSTRESKSSA